MERFGASLSISQLEISTSTGIPFFFEQEKWVANPVGNSIVNFVWEPSWDLLRNLYCGRRPQASSYWGKTSLQKKPGLPHIQNMLTKSACLGSCHCRKYSEGSLELELYTNLSKKNSLSFYIFNISYLIFIFSCLQGGEVTLQVNAGCPQGPAAWHFPHPQSSSSLLQERPPWWGVSCWTLQT